MRNFAPVRRIGFEVLGFGAIEFAPKTAQQPKTIAADPAQACLMPVWRKALTCHSLAKLVFVPPADASWLAAKSRWILIMVYRHKKSKQAIFLVVRHIHFQIL